jgi:hypothetical protein
MNDVFGVVAVVDFEYEIEPGGLPNPLCMVAYVLDHKIQHVRTIRMWREELLASKRPPFDIGPDALFVAYSAWAEMTCFKVLGWQFPVHIFDLHTTYLAASNLLLPYNPDETRKKPRKNLAAACRAYGIEGWENIDKETISEDIGHGNWRPYGQQAVFDYCEEDVKKSAELLRAMLRPGRNHLAIPNTNLILHWSNYSAKTVALIQAKGMPIDVELWNLVQENKVAVIRELLRQLDPSYGSDNPIYDEDGRWSYARFEQWLVNAGVIACPRLESGKLDTDGDAFRLMYHIPGIEGLHALKDSLRVITSANLPIGPDGCNRPSLFPFGTATGRNAHCKSLYNAHAGMRSFMVFPPDVIGLYLDWRTQEVGIAAAASDDPALKADYASGDIYHALARLNGLTNEPNPVRWKKDPNNVPVRNRMKPLQLGINYGMGVPSLARGLNRHPLIASAIIERHRRRYPRFWEWRENMVQNSMLNRRIESTFGWPLHITTSPNQRTLFNFPMQSGGAEMLRLAAWRLCEAGLVPSMLVHDGILLEVSSLEQAELAKKILRQAGRDVCDGFEIDVDEDQRLVGGARYRDKRPVAQKMWNTIMSVLETVGALKKVS